MDKLVGFVPVPFEIPLPPVPRMVPPPPTAFPPPLPGGGFVVPPPIDWGKKLADKIAHWILCVIFPKSCKGSKLPGTPGTTPFEGGQVTGVLYTVWIRREVYILTGFNNGQPVYDPTPYFSLSPFLIDTIYGKVNDVIFLPGLPEESHFKFLTPYWQKDNLQSVRIVADGQTHNANIYVKFGSKNNYYLDHIERADGTSLADDKVQGGDPPPYGGTPDTVTKPATKPEIKPPPGTPRYYPPGTPVPSPRRKKPKEPKPTEPKPKPPEPTKTPKPKEPKPKPPEPTKTPKPKEPKPKPPQPTKTPKPKEPKPKPPQPTKTPKPKEPKPKPPEPTKAPPTEEPKPSINPKPTPSRPVVTTIKPTRKPEPYTKPPVPIPTPPIIFILPPIMVCDPCIAVLEDKIDVLSQQLQPSIAGALLTTGCEPTDITAIPFSGVGLLGLSNQLMALADQIDLIRQQLCKTDCVAAVPAHWQTPPESGIKQMVLLLAPQNPDGSLGRADTQIVVPHWSLSKDETKLINLNYSKGLYFSQAWLPDNSKMAVYCNSKDDGKSLLNKLSLWIDYDYQPSRFSFSETKSTKFVTSRKVFLKYAKFFSKGRERVSPDWVVSFV